MPRPSGPPPSASSSAGSARSPSADDPWRERIAQLEIQLSAARASATRASADATAARERLDAQAARLDALDSTIQAALDRVEGHARDAKQAAERPIPLEDLRARMAEVDTASQSARAQIAAMRQELAENKRVDEARAVRLASIEGRVAKIQEDPRPAELRLAVDRLETRVLGMEREHQDLRAKLLDATSRAERDAALFTSAVEKIDRVLARLEELEEAQDALRAESAGDTILPRLADLEALVLENGRSDARLRKEVEDLRAAIAASPPATPHPRGVAAAPAPASRKKGGGFGIAGVGPKIEAKLRDAGVPDAAALAALDDEGRARVAQAIGVKRDKLDAWCEVARGA